MAQTSGPVQAETAAEYALRVVCTQHFESLGATQTHVYAVATDHNYGACAVGDSHTGGEVLFQLVGGAYHFVGGGGGQFAATDLEQLYHVPAPVAQALVEKLNAAYTKARGNH